MNKNSSVCIIGLGFVGLTLATIMAKKGFKVYGIEKKIILKKLKSKKVIFMSQGLIKILKKLLKKEIYFSFFNSKQKDINTYIISVGTPLNKSKKLLQNIF